MLLNLNAIKKVVDMEFGFEARKKLKAVPSDPLAGRLQSI